ncbi:hypothetical protein ACVWXM_005979 [Bradyrhizobium sp. GM7.3]
MDEQQGPPVERLDHDAVGEFLGFDHAEQFGDERLRIERLVRMVRIDLGLDVEAHARIAGFAHQREQLAQGRNTGPGHGALVGELLRVRAVWPDLADVIGPDVGEPQFHEGRAGRRDVGAARIPRDIRIEPALMRDDDFAVGGDADIELQRVHADRQRVGEGRKRVFRQQCPPAAMGLEVESRIKCRIESHGRSRNEK